MTPFDAVLEAVVCAVLHRLGETSITITQKDLQDLYRLYANSAFERHGDGSATFRLIRKPDPAQPDLLDTSDGSAQPETEDGNHS